MAIAVNRMFDVADDTMTEVFHIHKGACDAVLEERLGYKLEGSQEMTEHLVYLCYNAGFPVDDMKKWEDSDSLFGHI